MKKVLLIELSDSHKEIFIPVEKYLMDAGYQVDLFITENYDIDSEEIVKKVSNKNRIAQLISLNNFIKKNKYQNLFFNTAEGLSVRDFCFINFFNNLNICGVLHQAKKLSGSFTQKIISSKIKNYFVLAEYIKNFIKTNSINVEYFYPLLDCPPKIENNNFTITVPGEIASWRRDYMWLKNFAKQNFEKLNNRLKFIFLGSGNSKDGKEVIQFILNNNLSSIFKYYEDYVPEYEFIKVLQRTNLIFPLLNPGAGEYEYYKTTKISGAFNLAINYKIPLLLNNDFKDAIDFKNVSIFYNKDNFEDVIDSINLEMIKKYSNNFQKEVRFSYEYQSNKFRNFVNKIYK